MAQNLRTRTALPLPQHHDRYSDAGVNTDEADAGLKRLTARIAETWPPPSAMGGVQLDIGYFANVINICGQGIAITTDGIGSKAMIASMLGKYDTVGIDCVAMNVNDLICVGAKPVSMVDYIAVENVSAKMLDEISVGLCRGAEIADISISGGETSQLKDMINGFDLAGTAIGHVELNKILVGRDIQDGDSIIGVESNGIHSNGLSLARRALFEVGRYTSSHRFSELDSDLGSELLRPTHIYVREALELLEKISTTKALIHITSDGFLNLLRVDSPIGFEISALPAIPPIFDIIKRLADVENTEMFSVFNMGIGLCAVVGEDDAENAIQILQSHGKRACRLGVATSKLQRQVSIPQFKLIGEGKHFRPL